jgi:glycosyltransferase involved in cell wall biosynthesis
MKILIHQFLGKNHSWSAVGWGTANALINQGHEVELFSTDGIEHIPNNLRKHVIGHVEENKPGKIFGRLPGTYDCQISYTAMRNFQKYLSFGNKNRFGIWTYEWNGKNVLPSGFAKAYKNCDYLCAPSQFSKDIFINSGIPGDKVHVIPHGIGSEFSGESKIDLKTNKKFKILANIAQNHIRKNINGLLEAYGKAFNKNDDVILILKSKFKPVKYGFEVSLQEIVSSFKKKYPDHAELKIFEQFVPDISSLYRSVDTVFSLSHCEGFLMPGLESLASGKIVIAPNWGGQVDFLNDSNALLVSGKEARANPASMYWESKQNAIWFVPDIEDAASKLRYAYDNFISLNESVESQREAILKKYSWESITTQMLNLTK